MRHDKKILPGNDPTDEMDAKVFVFSTSSTFCPTLQGYTKWSRAVKRTDFCPNLANRLNLHFVVVPTHSLALGRLLNFSILAHQCPQCLPGLWEILMCVSSCQLIFQMIRKRSWLRLPDCIYEGHCGAS